MERFNEEVKSILDFSDDMAYFYHITGHGIGNIILEEGLMLSENRLTSTTVRITPDMIEDPIEFVESEHGNNIRKTDEMVLLGCPEEFINQMIEVNNEVRDAWNEDDDAEFIISPRYVIGYIDMDTFEITYNENYEYSDGYGMSR